MPHVRSASSGETRSPYTTRFGAFGQPCPSGLVGERGASGGEHREQQQRALAARRFAPECRKRQQVCGHDQRRQSGECDRVGQQPIDAGEHARTVPIARASGMRPVAAERDLGVVVRPVG